MMAAGDLALGIDIGTSGVRVVAMDWHGEVVAQAAAAMAAPVRKDVAITQHPAIWLHAIETAFDELRRLIDVRRIAAVAADGTSGTVLAVDDLGVPLADARMYNDPCSATSVAAIAVHVPATSAASGASSALGRALELQALRPHRILHQADWVAGMLSSQFDVTDENNALKTGYDPVARHWPDWIAATGMDMSLLPKVVPAGTVVGGCEGQLAQVLGLADSTAVVAGTTDGCAAFLATGADQLGDGVTSLGSTLVLKVLSDKPVFAPAYGIYSHRIGDMWLPGGASNTGGAALLAHFSLERMAVLQPELNPGTPTGLTYYPLPGRGERFPINDPDMVSRVTPRPTDDATFLQGLLEGIATVEELGFRRLTEIGAPRLRSLRTVGGGAANQAWTDIRKAKLGVSFLPARSEAAAAGVARLALNAMQGAL
jgi:D-ribulokinase